MAQNTSVSTPKSLQGTTTKVDLKKEAAQFNALKRSLDNIDSWELAGSAWEEGINMKFSQAFSEDVAYVFLRIIQ